MQQPKKKRRKVGWIGLIVLLVLAAGAAVLWNWQKNNIEAVMQYTKYSQEELESKLEENDQKVAQVLEEAMSNAQKVDQEQKPAVEETPEAEEPKPEAAKPAPEEPEQTQPEPSGPTYEELLQAIVDRVYALRDEYVAALEAMEKEAVAAYKALPAEKRTAKGKIEFASSYITRATELEKQCDASMDEIVAELTKLQQTYGQNLELVETVKYTYAQEKSLKKAWYMSELERRGMI